MTLAQKGKSRLGSCDHFEGFSAMSDWHLIKSSMQNVWVGWLSPKKWKVLNFIWIMLVCSCAVLNSGTLKVSPGAGWDTLSHIFSSWLKVEFLCVYNSIYFTLTPRMNTFTKVIDSFLVASLVKVNEKKLQPPTPKTVKDWFILPFWKLKILNFLINDYS